MEGEIADIIGVSHITFSKKLNKKSKIELKEAIKLGEVL